jgi:hypothetical protein
VTALTPGALVRVAVIEAVLFGMLAVLALAARERAEFRLYWRLRGLVRQLRGNTQDWGVMTRRGFAGPGEPPDDRPIAQAV